MNKSIIFAVGCSALVIAGCASDETCIEVEFEYAGQADGAVYIQASGNSGGQAAGYPSVASALAAAGFDSSRGSVGCADSDAVEDWTATVWVDVDGGEEEACANSLGNAGCRPGPDDPQGTTTTEVGPGYNIIRVTVVDQSPAP